MRSKRNCTIQTQTGAALLAFILLLLVSSTYILAKQLNQRDYSPIRNQTTLDALATAKEALIAYAVTYYENNPGEFGFLPCPSTGAALSEGSSDGNCGARDTNRLGKFPWKSLELPPLKDGSGECLWYAVSGAYKNNIPAAKTQMLNDDTRGAFRVRRTDSSFVANSDTDLSQRVVAVVIAPGEPINNQNRVAIAGTDQCGGNYTAANYLDSYAGTNNSIVGAGGADSIDTLISFDDLAEQGLDRNNDGVLDGNDQIITISAQEIWDAVKKRSDFADTLYRYDPSIVNPTINNNNLTYRIAQCLADYSNNNRLNHNDPMMNADGFANQSMPWPAPRALTDYRQNSDYSDQAAPAVISGRLPIDITNSNNAIYNSCGGVQTCTRPNDDLMVYCDNNVWTPAIGPVQADELVTLWQHWKDHLFYAVSFRYRPQLLINETGICNHGEFCITTDGVWSPGGFNEDWAAVVFFSNEVMSAQSRISPPFDLLVDPPLSQVDQKALIGNYLEGQNINDYNTALSTSQYYTSAGSNDVLYCIQDDDSGPPAAPVLEHTAALCP